MQKHLVARILTLFSLLFSFLIALRLMSDGFESFGEDAAKDLIYQYATNPIVALFIGMLATAITQSSSLTTSIVVSLVASGQFESIADAVPLIIGANIGTSITSTIVSLGHIKNGVEFNKAISAATLHDFFNLFITLIIFPLELATKFLSNLAIWIDNQLFSHVNTVINSEKSIGIIKSISLFLRDLWFNNPYITLLIAFTCLFISLKYISKILKTIFIGDQQKKFEDRVFGTPMKSMFWGVGLTAAVQSSSVTTSLTVPLVATNVVSLKKAFPFLLGANIGTTFTALIATLSNPNEASVSIALCHLLYNLIGVSIFMSFPLLQNIPIYFAQGIGALTQKRRWYGLVYVFTLFFAVPIFLIYISN